MKRDEEIGLECIFSAIIAYRMYRRDAKLISKFMHVVLHTLAVSLAGLGEIIY